MRGNVGSLKERVGDVAMMTVVKADGYGHGMVEVALAAREAGAEWLGRGHRRRGARAACRRDTGRVLCWLTVPGEDLAPGARRTST